MEGVFKASERLPEKDGYFLVYCPRDFPKNCRWLVAEYYSDNNTFYAESGEHAVEVELWTNIPDIK